MTIEEINLILAEAEAKKNEANSKTTAYGGFIEAENLYWKVFNLCQNSKDINEVQRDVLSSVYEFEALDCRYSYQVKLKDFEKAKKTNSKQKQIVERILSEYNEEELVDSQLKSLYQGFRDKRNTIELQALATIAKNYKEQDNYPEALYFYRRAEEVLRRVDISKLEGLFLINYNKNYHIIRSNISQCQLGVYRQEAEKDLILEKVIIKSLLFGIEETEKLLHIGGPDQTYEVGIRQMKLNICKILVNTEISWKDLLEQNNNNTLLQNLMELTDDDKYFLTFSSMVTTTAKEDRFIFYTHGFSTRGKWKEIFTEIISEKEKSSNIHFILKPWDYGKFIIQFLLPWARNRVKKEFAREYERITDRYGSDIMKCLVAHSFGTYLTSSALTRHPDIRFERIIYAGNILDTQFDWSYLKTTRQIDKVLIEKSTNDFIICLGQIYRYLPWVKWIGAAGRKGFSQEYTFVEIVESKSGHSGMLNENNIGNKWFNFLTS